MSASSTVAENSTYIAPKSLAGAAWELIRTNGLIGTATKYIQYKTALHAFERGSEVNSNVLQRFNLIDKNIACAHFPYQFILMAEYLLQLRVPGDIVECGAFKGGGTAKLSILAKLTGRKLFVCDSFSGLPRPESQHEEQMSGLTKNYCVRFTQGSYAGSLEEVRANVNRFGELSVCEFIPGFFNESLSQLKVTPAFVFTDVDLISSARACLLHLWPQMPKGALWFTHEAAFAEYIYGVLDSDWWHTHLNQCPPLMVGAGTGLSPLAEGIAYARKN